MSNIPEDLKYTKEHEWVKIEGETAIIGITDFAQESLGELVYVEFPEVGANFGEGDDMVIVESCKAASDVYAPLAGEVVEVNSGIEDTPETINSDPYASGWLVKLKLSNPADAEKLLSAAEYKEIAAE